MSKETPNQKNIIFDQIIIERRSNRRFWQEFPSKKDILSIIDAGLHAPFAAVSSTKDYFRRFFILKMGSKSMTTAAALIFEEVSTMLSKLELAMENDRSSVNKQFVLQIVWRVLRKCGKSQVLAQLLTSS